MATITSGSYSTISALADDDFVENYGSWVSINSSSGNDRIISGGKQVTIKGERGDDTLTGDYDGDCFFYQNGDGDDVITNYSFRLNDNLTVTDGSVYKTLFSGNDLIVSIGSGSVTFKDAKNQAINI